MRILIALTAVALAASALSQVSYGMFIPAGGGPMPNYFSGTNCRASGSAQVGDLILEAYLELNGETVASYIWIPTEPMPMSVSLAAMFDSSHWAPGTPVDVCLRVYGLEGYYEAHSSADPQVKNRIMIYEEGDPARTPDPSPVVSQLMSGKNYLESMTNGGPWTEETFLEDLEGTTVVYVATHGNSLAHWDGVEHPITPAEYETYRTAQKGSGIPPFNTGAPPIYFIHIQACHCGDTNAFSTACYPYYMAWGGPWMEDQALMAYACSLYSEDAWRHANEIWSRMSLGKTALRTQQEFNLLLQDDPPAFFVKGEDGQPRPMVVGDLRLYAEENVPLWGMARVKTVFTGDNGPPVGWCRQL